MPAGILINPKTKDRQGRQDVIEKYGDHWTDPEHIVTNGPFTLDQWDHEYKLILKSNPNYYDAQPALDRIIMYVVRNPSTELTLYETGELDMAELPPVAIPHYKTHAEYKNLPLLRGYYYGFNTALEPFDDGFGDALYAAGAARIFGPGTPITLSATQTLDAIEEKR